MGADVDKRFIGLVAAVVSVAMGFAVVLTPTLFVFLVILVGIPLLCWAIIWHETFAWCTYIASICFTGYSVDISGVTILPEQLALPVLVWLALCSRTAVQGNERRVITAMLTLGGMWLALSLVSSIASSPNLYASLRILVWSAASMIAFVLIRADTAKRIRRIKEGTVMLITVSVCCIGAWLSAQFLGHESTWVVLDYGSDVYRLKGPAWEPNILASLLAMWIALVLGQRLELGRRLTSTMVLLGTIVVILTLTRAAWIALVLCFGLLILRTYGSKAWLVGASIFVLLTIVGAGLVHVASTTPAQGQVNELVYRTQGLLDFDSGTGAYRSRIWVTAFEEIDNRDAWFTGLGTNSYSQRHEDPNSATGKQYLGNLWIALLYDGGVLGLVTYLALFLVLWRMSGPTVETSVIFVVLAVTAAATNVIWFAFPWVVLALMPLRQDRALHVPERTPARDVSRPDMSLTARTRDGELR